MDSEPEKTAFCGHERLPDEGTSSASIQFHQELATAMVEAIPHQAFVCNLDGVFQCVNSAFAGEWDRKPEDFIGKRDFELIPGLTGQNLETTMALTGRSGKVTYGGKTNNRLHFTTTPIRDKAGQIFGILGVTTTPEQHRMIEMRQSEAEFQRVWDHSFDGMRLVDMKGTMLMVNDAFCRMVEKKREELIGQHLSIIYAPEDQFGVTLRHNERSVSGTVISISEREHRLWNGKRTWFELSNSLIEIEDESPQMLSIFRDTTQRRQDEEKLRDFTARLERSNRELQDFAYVASHDLQEPLRKVTVFGDRLRTRLGPGLTDENKDYLDRMLNAARRMQTLINDLLSFSRITRKAQPFEPVNLDKAAREVVEDLEARIEQVGGRVELGTLPVLEAEPLQIRQLFQNLIGNALKFARPGVPPVIKVDSRRIEITNSMGDSVPMLELTVSDNGIGFDEKYATRIFQVFQRLHTRDVYEGTGMGLAIARKIAEHHGGSICARSTPDVGSTFIVTLPLTRKQQDTNPCPTT